MTREARYEVNNQNYFSTMKDVTNLNPIVSKDGAKLPLPTVSSQHAKGTIVTNFSTRDGNGVPDQVRFKSWDASGTFLSQWHLEHDLNNGYRWRGPTLSDQ